MIGQLKPAEDDTGSYKKISPELKVNLLEDSLLKAQDDYLGVDGKKDAMIATEQSKATELLKSKELEIITMKSTTQKLEDEVASLKKELARFMRLPVEFDLPKKKKYYTYQQGTPAASKEKYGLLQPSAMPPNATGGEAGYIYPEGINRWPVYYYKNS